MITQCWNLPQSLLPLSSVSQDYYYYDYQEDKLPIGPTRRPPVYEDDYYDYLLPSGPTKEPPLPSGPTRKPGKPTSRPSNHQDNDNIAAVLKKWLHLPLLTTMRPQTERKSRKGQEAVLNEAKKVFHSRDFYKEQFILPPQVNAGTLPLSVQFDLPANQFPPFRQQNEDNF